MRGCIPVWAGTAVLQFVPLSLHRCLSRGPLHFLHAAPSTPEPSGRRQPASTAPLAESSFAAKFLPPLQDGFGDPHRSDSRCTTCRLQDCCVLTAGSTHRRGRAHEGADLPVPVTPPLVALARPAATESELRRCRATVPARRVGCRTGAASCWPGGAAPSAATRTTGPTAPQSTVS